MHSALPPKCYKLLFSLLELLATPKASITRKDLISQSGIDKKSLSRLILNREIFKQRLENGKTKQS